MKRTQWLLAAALAAWSAPALAQEAAEGPEGARAPEGAEGSEGAEVPEVGVEGEAAQDQVLLLAVPKYEPLLGWSLGGVDLSFPLSISERVEAVSSFPADAGGAIFEADPAFNTQIRLAGRINTNLALAPIRLVADLELDALTGQHAGGSTLEGEFVPVSGEAETQLRKASVQLDMGPMVHLTGGFMVSHWGMGLLANDGAHGWEPGSASFSDPRGGDRVLRGLMALGPFFDEGLIIAGGVDKVQGDDALFPEDEALQVLTSVIYGVKGGPLKVGAYFVSRNQENALDGDTLQVQAFDVALSYTRERGSMTFKFESELAVVTGQTTLSPTPDFLIHDVAQIGAAMRASMDFGGSGLILDLLFASGDDNFDDATQSGFKVDNNYPLGLITHRFVLGAQSARAPLSASNPDLVGKPAEDLERFPTQGAITNTVAIFPRGWVRFFDKLELYGGPLLAFSERSLSDPFNARIAGGVPRNALDGDPGPLLGVELDLGARYRRIIAGSEFTMGIEGGVFFPGDAFKDAQGQNMEPVTAGRATLDYRF